MTEYEKLLDKMQFTIGTTLVDNDYCRKIEKHDEVEILRYNRRTFVELKVMMMRLERALYGDKTYEKDETEISARNIGGSDNSETTQTCSRSPRVGDFSC